MHTLQAAFASLEAPGTWEAIACPPLAASSWEVPNDVRATERARLRHEGWTRLPGLLAAREAQGLVDAIARLDARGIPALFAFALDAFWQLPERFSRVLEGVWGRSFDVLPDVWAWRIAPGRAGWPPHRGVTTRTRASLEEPPGLVNVWIALTRADEHTAGMWAVPLPNDPAYPSSLDDRSAAESGGLALAADAGTLLAWDANVLHWGGPIDANAAHPRVSASFTLRARGAEASFPGPALPLSGPATIRERLDLLAQMIETYDASDLPEGVRLWARATTAMLATRAP